MMSGFRGILLATGLVVLAVRPAQTEPIPLPSLPPLAQDWKMPALGKMTNPFGNGYWYYGVYRAGHTGVDIKAPAGTPVVAAAAGEVVRVFTRPNQRYGHYIVIRHTPDLYALYGHLGRILVKSAQVVEAGQKIAEMGRTGAAGYPHLHFEVLNQLPQRDGAWGYAYICRVPPELKEILHFNFLNAPAREMPVIRRQRQGRCEDFTIKSPVKKLVYYNPELFFADYQFKPWLSEFQPENEETWRWKKQKSAGLTTAVP